MRMMTYMTCKRNLTTPVRRSRRVLILLVTLAGLLLPAGVISAQDTDGYDGAEFYRDGAEATSWLDDLNASYSNRTGLWAQQARLEPTDGVPYSVFGFSVAVDGDTILVRSNKAAYVFVRDGVTWVQQARLTGSGEGFGLSVALEGNTALISAYGDGEQGVVYVFVREGTIWTQQAILTPNEEDADFAGIVSLSGDTALIGTIHDYYYGLPITPGSAYVFVRNGETWTQQAKITPDDGMVGDDFGNGVALDGDTALIGAPNAMMNENQSQGVAYVLRRNGSEWVQQAKLIANDGTAGDVFGFVTALDGNTALISALSADVNGNVDQGAAYVFVRNGADWAQQAKLVADDGITNQWFGRGVAVDGDVVLVGLRGGYLFRRTGTIWRHEQKLIPDDTIQLPFLGWAVALDGDIAVVGEPDLGSSPDYDGAAYVFQFFTSTPTPTPTPTPTETPTPTPMPTPTPTPTFIPTPTPTPILSPTPTATPAVPASYLLWTE